MGAPAAKQGDRITATDMHMVIVSGADTEVALPFTGVIRGALSDDVRIMGQPAAVVGSIADNVPPHVGTFQTPPSNKGTIQTGSATVRINGKPAARNGDRALTCNDPVDLPVGTVIAEGTVSIG